jgi:hypothetical protein
MRSSGGKYISPQGREGIILKEFGDLAGAQYNSVPVSVGRRCVVLGISQHSLSSSEYSGPE